MRLFFILLLFFNMIKPCFAQEKPLSPVSHKAFYDLSLYETKGGALSVVAATGKMSYEIRKACNAYETKTEISLGIGYEISGTDISFFKQKTTEGTDGCSFEFEVYSDKETQKSPDVAGAALCEKDKKKVTLTKPRAGEIVLPKTVLFPVRQTIDLLQAAKDGKKILSSYVYDGTKSEALHFVSTLIGAAGKPDFLNTVKGDTALLNGKSHWFDMAFYNDLETGSANDGAPLYEAGVHYYENGVSDEVIQNFGEYKLRSKLVKITRLDDLPCAKKERKAFKKQKARGINNLKKQKGRKKGA